MADIEAGMAVGYQPQWGQPYGLADCMGGLCL